MSYGLVRSRWIDPDGVEPARENRLRSQELVSDGEVSVDDLLDDWFEHNPETEVEDVLYAVNHGYASVLVLYRDALRADTPPPASPHTAEADDGFANLAWTETSPGRWVGESSDGATLTVMLATAMPGAWCWSAHGRYLVGYGLAGSEDEAKRQSWRAWREFEAVREVAGDGNG